MTRLITRWRALDWLIGRLSVATVGRGAMAALGEVISATTRLMLVAPAPVMEAMEVLSELIGRFDPGGSSWREEWQAARTAFAEVSRLALA